jgi:hypothetical protein
MRLCISSKRDAGGQPRLGSVPQSVTPIKLMNRWMYTCRAPVRDISRLTLHRTTTGVKYCLYGDDR